MRSAHLNPAPIDFLLKHWRAARHRSTSELLQRIAERLEVEVPRLPPQKNEAARRWLLAVKIEPPHLLSARLRQLESFTRGTSAATLWPLWEAVAQLPADPRFATLATRMLVGDVFVERTARLTRRLLDCVEKHGDDSHFSALEFGLPVTLLGDGLAARALNVMQNGLAHRPSGPELSNAERQRLATTAWAVPPPRAQPPSEFQPIWDNPRDTALRAVLADVLIDRNEPRGEFISLQLAHAAPKRQRALLKRHGARWLGTLAHVVDLRDEPPIFEDGFVAEVSVRAVKRSQFTLAMDAPEWATVKRVRQGLQRFSRSMVGLEDAGLVPVDALLHLAKEEIPLSLRSVRAAPAEPAVLALQKLPTSPPWVGLEFSRVEPSRALRGSLSKVADLPGLERLRLSARWAEGLPALLGQLGLLWLPSSLTQLELREGPRFVILRRAPQGWSLALVDLEPRGPNASAWKSLLGNLVWLAPVDVQLSVCSDLGEEAVKTLEHLARRFQLPVEAEALQAVPADLLW